MRTYDCGYRCHGIYKQLSGGAIDEYIVEDRDLFNTITGRVYDDRLWIFILAGIGDGIMNTLLRIVIYSILIQAGYTVLGFGHMDWSHAVVLSILVICILVSS